MWAAMLLFWPWLDPFLPTMLFHVLSILPFGCLVLASDFHGASPSLSVMIASVSNLSVAGAPIPLPASVHGGRPGIGGILLNLGPFGCRL